MADYWEAEEEDEFEKALREEEEREVEEMKRQILSPSGYFFMQTFWF